MADAPRIEVFPDKSGDWCWRHSEDGQKLLPGYSTRGEAIAAARKANGRYVNEVFNEGGTKVADVVVDGELQIVLLRADGSLYAEIDAPRAAGLEMPKRARLTPAESVTKAVGGGPA